MSVCVWIWFIYWTLTSLPVALSLFAGPFLYLAGDEWKGDKKRSLKKSPELSLTCTIGITVTASFSQCIFDWRWARLMNWSSQLQIHLTEWHKQSQLHKDTNRYLYSQLVKVNTTGDGDELLSNSIKRLVNNESLFIRKDTISKKSSKIWPSIKWRALDTNYDTVSVACEFTFTCAKTWGEAKSTHAYTWSGVSAGPLKFIWGWGPTSGKSRAQAVCWRERETRERFKGQ